jgi:hypothetical protein
MLSRTGKWSNTRIIKRTSLVIPTASDLADSLNINASFVKYVWVLGVCAWLSVNSKNKKMVPSGLLNIRNVKWFEVHFRNDIYFWYLSIFKTKYFYSSSILLGDFYLSNILFRYLYFYSSITIGYFFHHFYNDTLCHAAIPLGNHAVWNAHPDNRLVCHSHYVYYKFYVCDCIGWWGGSFLGV